MKREYWNVPEVEKKHLINTIIFGSVFAAYTVVFYVVMLIDVLREFLVLINVVLIVSIILEGIRDSRRMVSHPVCRFTDDFIILDYDRKVIPLETVTRIVVDLKRKIIKIWYPTIKDSLMPKFPQKHSDIRAEWMSNWDSFLENLEGVCNEHSIEMKRVSS
ncbi:MAG: hypothetical protein HXS44_08015 [Theionarchaea archaeon]|nr:hypothetical protein [Theionarchaea archaeon]